MNELTHCSLKSTLIWENHEYIWSGGPAIALMCNMSREISPYTGKNTQQMMLQFKGQSIQL